MAPELLRGGAPTAASDLYALGVVIYRALTGALPVSGAHRLQLQAKEACWFESPDRIDPGVDGTLARLAMDLLAADPAQRPHLPEVRQRLGGHASAAGLWVERPTMQQRVRDALPASDRPGRHLWISGPSGAGKSALVRRVLQGRPELEVLWGGSSPVEHTSFGALDAIADQLYLRAPRWSSRAWWLAAERAARMFPVLSAQRSDQPRAPSAEDLPIALDGLAMLLDLVAAQDPLLIVIDDAQWLRSDVRLALAGLRAKVSAWVSWLTVSRDAPEQSDADVLVVGAIPAADVRALLGRPLDIDLDAVPAFAVPWLARSQWTASGDWDERLRTTWRGLPAPAHDAIAWVALAAGPLRRTHLAQLGVTSASVRTCVVEGWVRQWVERDAQLIAPVHARHAEAVRPAIVDIDYRHRVLADVLAADGPAWAAMGAVHYAACGASVEAGQQHLRAGIWAADHGAFVAARTHLQAAQASGMARHLSALELGRVHSAMGDTEAAIAEWEAGIEGAPPDRVVAIWARMAMSLIGRGELVRGVDLLARMLASVGERFPATRLQALWRGVLAPSLGLVSGVADGDAGTPTRLTALWIAARSVSVVDPLQCLALQVRHETVAAALGAPEQQLLAASWRLWMTLAERGEAGDVESGIAGLSAQIGELRPELRVQLGLARGYGWYLAGRWGNAAEHLDALQQRVTGWVGQTWEARFCEASWTQAHVEDHPLPASQSRLARIRADCTRRGDRLGRASIDLAIGYQVALLSTGRVDAAEAVIADALAIWNQPLLPDLEFRLVAARTHVGSPGVMGLGRWACWTGRPSRFVHFAVFGCPG